MTTTQDVIGDFTPLSNNVVRKLKLVRGAIACKIFFTSNLEDRICRMGQTRIANELGLEVSTVSKGLKWLVDSKYIEQTKEHTPTDAAHYRCTKKFYKLAKGIDLINPPIDLINTPIDLINQEEDSEEELKEDMGASAKNGLDDYFEPKPPIEPTPLKKPLKDRIKDKDPELLMSALGVTAISRAAPGEVLIKDSGWNIGNERIRGAIAHFIDATGLPVPAKTERGKWLKQAQLHLEEFKADDLPRLYKEAWGEYKPQILAGHIDITHPGALTTKMRAILQRQVIKLSELSASNPTQLNPDQLTRYQQLRAEEQVGR